MTAFAYSLQSIDDRKKTVRAYCKSLVGHCFRGETSNHYGEKITDKTNIKRTYNLGLYLYLLDSYFRELTAAGNGSPLADDEYIQLLLKLVSLERRNENETMLECLQRLRDDMRRFLELYFKQERKVYPLRTNEYWGTRQQLRAGKVIADWVDPVNGPMDPVFGVLLCPTAGRTGPGDSVFLHNLLFDQSGPIAYHSAVHDAFGFLKNYLNTGPGYNYLANCSLFSTDNPAAGQISGINFWEDILLTRNRR